MVVGRLAGCFDNINTMLVLVDDEDELASTIGTSTEIASKILIEARRETVSAEKVQDSLNDAKQKKATRGVEFGAHSQEGVTRGTWHFATDIHKSK